MTATIVFIALVVVVVWAMAHLMDLWQEWRGALGRWRRGEPLRASELRALEYKVAREQRAKRKDELRREYESNPTRILEQAFRREFLVLEIHRDIRYEVIRRCGYKCAACGREIKRKSTLHIDHIKPRKSYPALAYLASNLQVLCSRCNVHKSAYDGDDWKEIVVTRRKATRIRKAKARRSAASQQTNS